MITILMVLGGLVLLVGGGAVALMIGLVNLYPGGTRASSTAAYAALLAGLALLVFGVLRAF